MTWKSTDEKPEHQREIEFILTGTYNADSHCVWIDDLHCTIPYESIESWRPTEGLQTRKRDYEPVDLDEFMTNAKTYFAWCDEPAFEQLAKKAIAEIRHHRQRNAELEAGNQRLKAELAAMQEN